MSVQISNGAGEIVAKVADVPAAVAWFLEQGRGGDYILGGPGLSLAELAREAGHQIQFDRMGCVVVDGVSGWDKLAK